jgi:hypothetical protein
MRTRSLIAALLLAASSAALPCRHAAAQEKDAVTDMARRRFQEGVKFFDQKKYEEARAAFLQAYALKHHPAVLLNLAHSEIRSGHNVEAARHFATYLRDPPPSATAAEKAEAEKSLASARSKLGRIQVSVATGAEVVVDGESLGQAPLPEAVDAAPGNHTVEARLGGRSTSTSVTVTLGKTATASLAVDGNAPPAAPPPPPPPPQPAATPTPPPPPPETPEAPPPQPEPPKAGNMVDTSVQLSTSGREGFFSWLGHSPVGLVGVGLTGIGLGVGIGFALNASKASDNADSVAAAIQAQIDGDNKMGNKTPSNVCSPSVSPQVAARYQKACGVLSDDFDKRDSDKTIATAGFVGAGIGLVTVTVGYLVSSKSSTSKATLPSKNVAQAPSAVVVPVISTHESGIAILGRF